MRPSFAVLTWVVVAAPLALTLGCSRADKVDPYADEVRAREAFAKKMLEEADAGRALNVASSSEVQFEEGFGPLSFELDGDSHPSFTNHAFRWMGQNAHVRLKTHGPRPMRIHMEGWVHRKVVGTQPIMNLFIDGVYIASSDPIGGNGHYKIDKPVPEWALRRPWVDLVIRTTAVGFHWSDAPELKVLNIYNFSFKEDTNAPASR